MTTTAGMVTALYGIKAEEKRLEVLTQNLANISTPGYKAEVGLFESILLDLQELLGGDATSVEPGETVTVQQFTGLSVDMSSGPIRPTGNPLDFGLLGDGFFVIETPDGTRYTRRGHFLLESTGQLVNTDGFAVQGQGGPINLGGGNDVTVDSKGQVSLDGTPVGTLRVVTFEDTTLLERDSGGLFTWTGDPLDVTDLDDPQVVQGSFELSNVNPIRGMTEMISTLRTYEAAARVLKDLGVAERQAAREIAQIIG
jgi:flagellar basal-body rod protein FlgF